MKPQAHSTSLPDQGRSSGTGWIVPLPDAGSFSVLMQKLIVSDSDRAVMFYTTALGMKVVFRLEPPGAPFSEIILAYSESPDAARIVVSCALRDGPTPGIPLRGTPFPKGVPFTNTIIQVPDLPGVLIRVKEMGGAVAMAPHQTEDDGHGGLLLAFVQDPDGHVLELMQFPPFDNSWPKFDITRPPKSLLSLFGAKDSRE